MKRSPLKRKAPERPPKPDRSEEFASHVKEIPRRGTYASATTALVKAPKDDPLRSESYRRLVAALPCAHCGVSGYSQAAHGDAGKGLSIKSSDDTCYPACGPRTGIPGCHWLIGTSGQIAREDRRALEIEYARRTKEILGIA